MKFINSILLYMFVLRNVSYTAFSIEQLLLGKSKTELIDAIRE